MLIAVGVLVSPNALNAKEKANPKKEKGILMNITLRYLTVFSKVSGGILIALKIGGVDKYPKIAATVENTRNSVKRLPIDFSAFLKSPLPWYCEIKANPAIPNPIPRLIIVPKTGQESVGDETAVLPSLPSQKVSVRL